MGGNSDDHFSRRSINARGNASSSEWGEREWDPAPNLSNNKHLDGSKNDRKGLRAENGWSNSPDKLDKPVIASDKRARASSDVETYNMNQYPYGGPSSRQK